jgi:hypothetical protein
MSESLRDELQRLRAWGISSVKRQRNSAKTQLAQPLGAVTRRICIILFANILFLTRCGRMTLFTTLRSTTRENLRLCSKANVAVARSGARQLTKESVATHYKVKTVGVAN